MRFGGRSSAFTLAHALIHPALQVECLGTCCYFKLVRVGALRINEHVYLGAKTCHTSSRQLNKVVVVHQLLWLVNAQNVAEVSHVLLLKHLRFLSVFVS